MKPVPTDENLIAMCGFYCGACKQFLKNKCPGCLHNANANWCKIRNCGLENHYHTCAECKKFSDPKDCRKINHFISKLFNFIFRTDRNSCIRRIKQVGKEQFAQEMAKAKLLAIKK